MRTLINLDVTAIQEYQKNRAPCLFVDVITEVTPGVEARGYKNFTYNEWFFPCHFEDEPNVPGFIQIESLTQVFLMTFLTLPENKGKKTGFISVDGARFKRKVVPGDRLEVYAQLDSYRRGLARGRVQSSVGGEPACELSLVVAIPDVLAAFTPKVN